MEQDKAAKTKLSLDILSFFSIFEKNNDYQIYLSKYFYKTDLRLVFNFLNVYKKYGKDDVDALVLFIFLIKKTYEMYSPEWIIVCLEIIMLLLFLECNIYTLQNHQICCVTPLNTKSVSFPTGRLS